MAPTSRTFELVCIADMDQDASVEGDHKTWKSLLRKGTLTYNFSTSQVSAEFDTDDKDATVLKSSFNYGGRGMELSDLLKFNGKMYTVCDKTGIVYEICDGKMIPWVILSSGDGRQKDGFKGEWMTVKDGLMYIGGHGNELTGRGGKLVHHDYMWVKTISENGAVHHYDWTDNYNAIRKAANCPYPGYLTHESGEWSEHLQSWIFLPRKSSPDPYDHKKDEQMGTNMLFKCSPDFSQVDVITVGELTDRKKGFSSFKFVPDTNDEVVVAIRSEECDDKCRTHVTVFKIDGTILLEDQLISDDCKYEGIEFVDAAHR